MHVIRCPCQSCRFVQFVVWVFAVTMVSVGQVCTLTHLIPCRDSLLLLFAAGSCFLRNYHGRPSRHGRFHPSSVLGECFLRVPVDAPTDLTLPFAVWRALCASATATTWLALGECHRPSDVHARGSHDAAVLHAWLPASRWHHRSKLPDHHTLPRRSTPGSLYILQLVVRLILPESVEGELPLFL